MLIYFSYEEDTNLFNFDYKADLLKIAVERDRVFKLQAHGDSKIAEEEYKKINPVIKY